MRKIIITLLVLSGLLFSSQVVFAKNVCIFVVDDTDYYLNSVKKSSDVAPLVKNSRTLVPLRLISEIYGATVEWVQETQTIKITADGAELSLGIGDPKMSVNGKIVILDTPPEIFNERTYVPLRAIVEALGKQLSFKDSVILISDEKIELSEDEIQKIKDGTYFSLNSVTETGKQEEQDSKFSIPFYYSPIYIGMGFSSDKKIGFISIENDIAIMIDGDLYSRCTLRKDGTVAQIKNNKYFGYKEPVNTFHYRDNNREPWTNTDIKGMKDIIQISGNIRNVIGLNKEGNVFCWGDNKYGQLGAESNKIGRLAEAVQTENIKDVVLVKAGYRNSFAVKNDGSVWAWGWNYNGFLGDGTEKDKSTPVKIEGIKDLIQIEATNKGIVALDDKGNLWTWGKIGDMIHLSPKQLKGISDVAMVSTSDKRTVVLKKDSTLWECRHDNIDSDEWKFTQIETKLDICYIKALNYSTYAVDKQGRLWGWGQMDVTLEELENNHSEVTKTPKRLDSTKIKGQVMLPESISENLK